MARVDGRGDGGWVGSVCWFIGSSCVAMERRALVCLFGGQAWLSFVQGYLSKQTNSIYRNTSRQAMTHQEDQEDSRHTQVHRASHQISPPHGPSHSLHSSPPQKNSSFAYVFSSHCSCPVPSCLSIHTRCQLRQAQINASIKETGGWLSPSLGLSMPIHAHSTHFHTREALPSFWSSSRSSNRSSASLVGR